MNYEQLGYFYLGKNTADDLYLYRSRDLLTHAFCVGMTGSGKTGLCIDLLEEAAIDGIPALIVDPKGDLANLCLTFPELSAADLEPWVSDEEARLKGMSREAFAEAEATRWREGLANWQQTPERSRLIRENAELMVYSPGANHAQPISLAGLFKAPAPESLQDSEALAELLSGSAAGLLALLGKDTSARGREQLLLEKILETAWLAGHDLDLEGLIRSIQNPPFSQVGILPLEQFYPEKDRFQLLLEFNNLLASPSLSTWFQGEDLDIDSLLYTPEGRPRMAILSIAHLAESERMFFVSILLNRLLIWMRRQRGSGSLRAIFYMDEIFGYFPPIANPPSKKALLTLLKQARAFGLGLVLSTQNPVDLDYKGLANIGTWLIGRLQTERDRARLLDGLEGSMQEQGEAYTRSDLEQTLINLGKRQFLVRNVHEAHPQVIESRWALSYLCGPMSREDLRLLRDKGLYGSAQSATRRVAPPAAEPLSAAPSAAAAAPAGIRPLAAVDEAPTPLATPQSVAVAPQDSPAPAAAAATQVLAVLPKDVNQFFEEGAEGTLYPYFLAGTEVSFQSRAVASAAVISKTYEIPLQSGLDPLILDDIRESELREEALKSRQPRNSQLTELPEQALQAKSWQGWSKDLSNWLYRNVSLSVWECPALKLKSESGESEADFRRRVDQTLREQRDEALEKLEKKYATKLSRAEEKVRVAGQRVDREKEEAEDAKRQSWFSIGSSVLGALFGKKLASASNVTRAASAGRAVSRSGKQKKDVTRAEETLEKYQQDLEDLQAQMDDEVEQLKARFQNGDLEIRESFIKPLLRDCKLRWTALVWKQR